jgi:ribonuclease D
VSDPHRPPKLVVNEGEVARVCKAARAQGALALDTEADSFHSYFHKLCLVQLSFAGGDYLIDPLALERSALQPLAAALGDRSVRKLMHGADYDLRVLDRDLGAHVANLADTQVAAQLLGEPQTGLAALLEKWLGVHLDKRFQRADWGARPLPPQLVAYAAGDTAHLEALADLMAQRLDALHRLEWWREECKALETVRWEPPRRNEFAFERIKGAGRLKGPARDRLAALHAWRELVAAGEDVPSFRVLRGESLIALAVQAPTDLQALAKVPSVGAGTARRYGPALLALLASPPPAPVRERRRPPPVDREREARLREARTTRDEAAAALGIDPGVLAPRASLETFVDRLPLDETQLCECLARRWRAAELAPRLLPLAVKWRAGESGAHAQPE